MVDLKNWEFFSNTGAAVIGATVTPYVASDTHPNPNAAAAVSTTTDSNGMWSFTGLNDAYLYDIKVEYGSGKIKWYKGNAKLAIGHLYDDTVPAVDRNLLPNGGQQSWHTWARNGVNPITIGSGTEIADHWLAYVSGGDSGTATRAPAGAINAQYATQFTYTRVGGNLQYLVSLPSRIVEALSGKTVSFAISVYQTTNAKLYAFINDGVGETTGAETTATGSWVTIWVTRAVSSSATSLLIGIRTNSPSAGAYTIYTCNAILGYGSTQPVYSINATELGGDASESNRLVGMQTLDQAIVTSYGNNAFLSEALSFFAKRLKEVIGATNWSDAVPATLTSLLAAVNLKAPLASPTFTGTLSAVTGVFTATVQATQFISTLATGTAPFQVSSTTKVTNLNADLLDGSEASAFAAASHSHNIVSGSYTGNGAAGRVIVNSLPASSNPRLVVVQAVSGDDDMFFCIGHNTLMTDPDTGTLATDTTAVQTTTTGFNVNGNANTSGRNYIYIIIGA